MKNAAWSVFVSRFNRGRALSITGEKNMKNVQTYFIVNVIVRH